MRKSDNTKKTFYNTKKSKKQKRQKNVKKSKIIDNY